MALQKNKIKEYFPVLVDVCSSDIIDSIYSNKDHVEYSHNIKGRWENHYLGLEFVPGLKHIFNFACKAARDITERSVIVPYKGLGFPFDEYWFNIAKPGESTGWHDHKDNAILSGVYYLSVPDNSGHIKFRKKGEDGFQEWSVNSEEGKMILFDSKIEHAVPINKSNKNRISLAFNLYSLPLDMSMDANNYSSNKFYS